MAETPPSGRVLVPEPGSYRDPAGRVVSVDGAVYRTLDQGALKDREPLSANEFFAESLAAGRVARTELVPADKAAEMLPNGEWVGLLHHEETTLVSYPYEWTFSMLKATAPLQLDLLAVALAGYLILKDATPFNFGFRGARPVFIDIGPVQRLEAGTWGGYRQFCRLYRHRPVG
jgi:hypothetical protein